MASPCPARPAGRALPPVAGLVLLGTRCGWRPRPRQPAPEARPHAGDDPPTRPRRRGRRLPSTRRPSPGGRGRDTGHTRARRHQRGPAHATSHAAAGAEATTTAPPACWGRHRTRQRVRDSRSARVAAHLPAGGVPAVGHGRLFPRATRGNNAAPSNPTLGVSCCRKPQRRRSGGWRQSAARPCWAPEQARGCAVVTPPADLPPRPPQDAVPAPRQPTAVPDTPTSRRCRMGRDTASASPHPPRPVRRDPRGPLAPAPSACAATPRSTAEVRRQTRRAGGATRAGGTGMHYERRGAAALRHRCARAVGDGGPGPAVPQAAPRRTPRALPALGVEERTLCRGEPARAGGAPSHAGERSQEWQNLLAWGGASAGLPPAPLAPNAGAHLLPEAAATQERSNCLDCQGGLVYFFSFGPPGLSRASDASAWH